MAQLISLSDDDLTRLRGELAAGRSPMVWFTRAAVGVATGGSAKIVAFADTAEGDYIQVRPTGSKDVLSFSPSELTVTRPPRRKATAPKSPRTPRAPKLPDPAPAPPPPAPPTAQPPEVIPVKPVQPVPPDPSRRRRPARSSASAEVTVTLTSTPSGDWTVEVVVGKKRTVRALPVPPADVARAARALPPQVSEAIDAALSAARTQQQARVAQLQAELEHAQRALKDLS